MKKAFIISLIILGLAQVCFANKADSSSTTIHSGLFSIGIPDNFKNTYEAKTTKDKIEIYHKASKEAGFGGFAFGIKAYKSPSEHANLPGGKKIGELKSRFGRLYDVVLKYPTDVQFDYTKGPKASKDYAALYDFGEKVKVEGYKGAKYFEGQGMKGEDLYKKVIEKHILAINKKSDSIKLEKENMSYMYNVLSSNNTNVLDKIGFAYYDSNGDGIDELFIGEIAEGNWKGVVYDIYTMVNRTPKHVISGGSRNRFFACDEAFICNEYSNGANESGIRVYALEENSTELFPQVSFKYDGYSNSKKPWFISYGSEINEEKWENVDEKTYKERKRIFEKYTRFNYTPLSQFKL